MPETRLISPVCVGDGRIAADMVTHSAAHAATLYDFLIYGRRTGGFNKSTAEPLLRRSSVQFVGEVQQEGYMQVALGFLDFRPRENGEAFAVRMQVENPNKVRQ